MPISQTVNEVWTKGLGHKRGAFLEAERVTNNYILPSLGFSEIVWFTQLNARPGFKIRNFIFDFYAERDNEKWLIDVTTAKVKRLDRPLIHVFQKMGVQRYGVIFVTQTLDRYFFKPTTDEDIAKSTPHFVLRVTLKELAYEGLQSVLVQPQLY